MPDNLKDLANRLVDEAHKQSLSTYDAKFRERHQPKS